MRVFFELAAPSRWRLLQSLLLLLLLVQQGSWAKKVNNDFATVEAELGRELGITPSSTVDQATIQTILKGVDAGNKDSIYFFALYKLHGIALSKNATVAALNFQRAADLGHVEATTAYAVMRLYGQGGDVDHHAALTYLRRGVTLGDLNAHFFLGKLLLEGEGSIEARPEEAYALLTRAAEGSVPQADHYLGVCREYGLGAEQDFQKAFQHYSRAAAQNQPESTYHLALMHAYGRGTQQDFRLAYALLDNGARNDHAPSMYYIGLFHLYGYGREPDYDKALNWFLRAGVSDDDRISADARKAADELREKIDAAHATNEATIDAIKELSERF